MDCQCVDSATFVLVYVAYIVLYALRVFPAVTRLTVYRWLRVGDFGRLFLIFLIKNAIQTSWNQFYPRDLLFF